jgi:ParB-like chromosome segregation protein Spo0J
MNNSIQSIAIDRLIPHPDNPNRMSKANFDKLVRNIERSGRYEPLVVRPIPKSIDRRERKDCREEIKEDNSATSACSAVKNDGCYQIINGHHRRQALKQLGYKTADVVVWDIDDHEADILLATLNRLGGRDSIEKKLALLKRLNEKLAARELAKLLPQTAKQIERLTNLKLPAAPATMAANHFANPIVFFVDDTQQQIIEQAMSLAMPDRDEKTRAAARAAALTTIALGWLESKPATRGNQL